MKKKLFSFIHPDLGGTLLSRIQKVMNIKTDKYFGILKTFDLFRILSFHHVTRLKSDASQIDVAKS